MTNEDLVKELIYYKVLKTPGIIEAFRKIDRANFVLPEHEAEAYANYPLPIGLGQTISQPLTLAFILELSQPKEEDKLLEIGAGTRWQTALLAHLVGPNGKLYGLQRLEELAT